MGKVTQRIGRTARRFAEDRDGVAAVEFAILATPFFLVLFVLLETATIFMGEIALERGVETLSRQVRTGEIDTPNMTHEIFRDRLCDEVRFMMDCDRLHVDLSTYDDYSQIQVGVPKKNGNNDYSGLGYSPNLGPERITTLRAFYDRPIYMDVLKMTLADGKGDFVMLAMTAFKTEAY